MVGKARIFKTFCGEADKNLNFGRTNPKNRKSKGPENVSIIFFYSRSFSRRFGFEVACLLYKTVQKQILVYSEGSFRKIPMCETKQAIRWREKWLIILDGYTSRKTDYELVHFNGEKLKYKNFIYEDPTNGYPFATTYGPG